MLRLLSTTFILLALVVGTVGAAPVAYATETCPADHPLQASGVDGLCFAVDADGNVIEGSGVDPIVTEDALSDSTLANNAASAADAAAAVGEGNAKPADVVKADPDSPYNIVMQKIMGLFAWLVGAAALTLDYAMFYTVVNMGSYIKNLEAIGVTWQILRDIGNIMLIFGFLAIGITTILNVDWYGGGTKMLPKMLMAAVFLNFSLFITEAIIDTGNLFATQFYTQINGNAALNAPSMPGSISELTNLGQQQGISSKIMNKLGLQTIYGNGTTNAKMFGDANPWFIGFMGILLFIVTAFVLFSLAFVLIARFVILIFLIILAPVGFAGLAVPQLAARAQSWWDKLFEQTITAPILLLMLYIALRVITDGQFLVGFGVSTVGGSATGFVENGNLPGFAGFLLSFIVAMGLLILVVIQSKNLSAFGAAGASKLAGKLTFGATAWGVNRTVGRGAYHLARVARQSAGFNKINALTGRVLTGALDRTAKASFDVRGATIGGGLKGLNIEAGDAQKGGFMEARTKNIKSHEEEAKRIETAHKEALRDTKEDRMAIAQATENLKKVTEAKDTAQTAKDTAQTAEQQAKTRQLEDKAELDRLRAIDTDDRNAGRPSTVGNALREAEQKSIVSDANLKAAASNLEKAANDLKVATAAETVAEKAKTTAEGAAETRMKENIKEGKTAYAEGIDHLLNPITFVAYGPGTATAARNIKNSLKEKPTKDKFLDMAKKMAKELEEKDGSKEEKEEKKEEKPEAPKS